MKLKHYLISFADGVIQSFCVTKVLSGIAFSQFVLKITLQPFLIIGCIIALATATSYFFSLFKEKSNKNTLKISAISFISFIISSPILFALPFTIFPQREIGDADGLMYMLILTFFLITAVIVRLGIFIGILIRNKNNT